MPHKSYCVVIQGIPHELELKRTGSHRELHLCLDNEDLGKLDELRIGDGVEIQHKIGRFKVVKVDNFLQKDFDISFNDELISGSAHDPIKYIKFTSYIFIFLAFCNLFIGALAESEMIGPLKEIGGGWYNLIMAKLFLLAWITTSFLNRSIGVVGGLAVFFIDSYLLTLATIDFFPQYLIMLSIIRLCLLIPIFRGLIAAFNVPDNPIGFH